MVTLKPPTIPRTMASNEHRESVPNNTRASSTTDSLRSLYITNDDKQITISYIQVDLLSPSVLSHPLTHPLTFGASSPIQRTCDPSTNPIGNIRCTLVIHQHMRASVHPMHTALIKTTSFIGIAWANQLIVIATNHHHWRHKVLIIVSGRKTRKTLQVPSDPGRFIRTATEKLTNLVCRLRARKQQSCAHSL